MITAGYMGAVSVVTTVKWFWFLFGMAMFLPVIYSLARTFRETVITRKDPEMIELYGKIAWLTIIMWSFYPVVWLFSEGFASFSVSFEVAPSPMSTPTDPRDQLHWLPWSSGARASRGALRCTSGAAATVWVCDS